MNMNNFLEPLNHLFSSVHLFRAGCSYLALYDDAERALDAIAAPIRFARARLVVNASRVWVI